MAMQQHLEALREKHASLEQAIEEESLRPQPDDGRLHELKREKLKIKDEISHCEEPMAAH